MLTISERRRLHEMNGVVAKVKRTAPRMVGDRVPPPFPAHSSPPQSTAAAISPDDPNDNLRAARGIVYGVILGALLWLPIGAWIYSGFTTP